MVEKGESALKRRIPGRENPSWPDHQMKAMMLGLLIPPTNHHPNQPSSQGFVPMSH